MREQDEGGKVELAVKRAVKLAEKRGEEKTKTNTISKLYGKGVSPEEIADLLDLSTEEVQEIIRRYLDQKTAD